MDKKGLAIGVSDFKTIIEKNCYYFDRGIDKRWCRSKIIYTSKKIWKNLKYDNFEIFFHNEKCRRK